VRLPRAANIVVFGAFVACPACAPAGGVRDVAGASRDVVVSGTAETRSSETYDYVAKRPLAVVALAEARGVPSDDARRAVDHLADALDACVTEQARKTGLQPGAARVIAQIGPSGSVEGSQLRVDPGPGVAEVALLCLVAPARLLAFAPTDAGARGFAIEALWGHLAGASAPP